MSTVVSGGSEQLAIARGGSTCVGDENEGQSECLHLFSMLPLIIEQGCWIDFDMMVNLAALFSTRSNGQFEGMWKSMAETLWPGNCREVFIDNDAAFAHIATHRDIFFWFRDRGGCFAALARLLKSARPAFFNADVEVGLRTLEDLVSDRWTRPAVLAFDAQSSVWKAIAITACSSRHVVDALYNGCAAIARNAGAEDGGAGTDSGMRLYRDVVMGLIARRRQQSSSEMLRQQFVGPLPSPEHRMRVKDLMMVIQINRKVEGDDGEIQRKALASYSTTDLAALFAVGTEQVVELRLDGDASSDMAPFFFQGENPMAATRNNIPFDHSFDPVQEASWRGSESLVVSCRLFRTDGGRLRQIFLIDRASAGDGEVGRAFGPNVAVHGSKTFYVEQEGDTNQIPRLAVGTAKSLVARQMLLSRQCDNIYFFAEIEFSPRPVDIPPPIDGWTRTLRNHHDVEPRPDSDNPTWTEQDREELSRIDHFRFQASKLVVSFKSYGEQTDQQGRVYDMPRNLSTTDKLLFFEGFDWQ